MCLYSWKGIELSGFLLNLQLMKARLKEPLSMICLPGLKAIGGFLRWFFCCRLLDLLRWVPDPPKPCDSVQEEITSKAMQLSNWQKAHWLLTHQNKSMFPFASFRAHPLGQDAVVWVLREMYSSWIRVKTLATKPNKLSSTHGPQPSRKWEPTSTSCSLTFTCKLCGLWAYT